MAHQLDPLRRRIAEDIQASLIHETGALWAADRAERLAEKALHHGHLRWHRGLNTVATHHRILARRARDSIHDLEQQLAALEVA